MKSKKIGILFAMGFSTAFLLVVNVVFAAQENYLGVGIFLFFAYLMRGLAIKDLNGNWINSVIFALGASCGGMSGLWGQKNLLATLFS
jgi:hypothetical protein